MSQEKNTNPYVDSDGNATIRECSVAFMDLLGFSSMVLEAHKAGNSLEVYRKLKASQEEAMIWIGTSPDDYDELKKDPWQIRTFSDCIVVADPLSGILGDPRSGEGESEICGMINDIAAFQLMLTNDGYFLRGCMTVGEFLMDDEFIFGEALIRTYEGESKMAVNPRILIINPAIDHLRHHLGYYSPPSFSAVYKDILQDADGSLFISYLNAIYLGEYPFYDMVEKHRDVVHEKLTIHRNDADLKIFKKYEWVAQYHNFFCSEDADCMRYRISLNVPPINFSRVDQKSFPIRPYPTS